MNLKDFDSALEFQLWAQIDQANLPMPCCGKQQFILCGHKVDFAWPRYMVCAEVQGGGWGRGAHHRAKGYSKDRMLSNRRQLEGWICLEFTGDHLDSDVALPLIRQALREHGWKGKEIDA